MGSLDRFQTSQSLALLGILHQVLFCSLHSRRSARQEDPSDQHERNQGRKRGERWNCWQHDGRGCLFEGAGTRIRKVDIQKCHKTSDEENSNRIPIKCPLECAVQEKQFRDTRLRLHDRWGTKGVADRGQLIPLDGILNRSDNQIGPEGHARSGNGRIELCNQGQTV